MPHRPQAGIQYSWGRREWSQALFGEEAAKGCQIVITLILCEDMRRHFGQAPINTFAFETISCLLPQNPLNTTAACPRGGYPASLNLVPTSGLATEAGLDALSRFGLRYAAHLQTASAASRGGGTPCCSERPLWGNGAVPLTPNSPIRPESHHARAKPTNLAARGR